jgi:tRNA uridine 5-carboxymethylaminomethyl modification enzyme
LRIDNADRRLTPYGRKVGLISDAAWQDYQAKQQRLAAMKKLLEKTKLTSAMQERVNFPPPVAIDPASVGGQSFAQLLKRPEIIVEHLVPALRELSPEFFIRGAATGIRDAATGTTLPSEVRNELKSVETEIKYEGYLLQQQRAIARLKKAELHTIPEWFDYGSISGLSREVQETLLKIRPRTLAHASRIPGVTAAAVSLVHVYIEIQSKRREQAAAI